MITAIELKDGLGSLEYGTDPFGKPCIYYVDERLEKHMTKLDEQLLILKDGIIKSFIFCMICFCNLLNHSGLKKAWQ